MEALHGADEGRPGLETWKSLDAARHGGAQVWVPGSYDPETHLYITGTGNPTPAYTSQTRGEGDNLYTCSLVAVNVDTGKMQWYYQTSPHDTHDWDSAQTPVLVDAPFGGRMRKLVLTAARNGYYFTLDRVTGEHLVTGKFSDTVNWAKGLNEKGQPVRDPKKDHDIGGALVSSANGGATNWPPPTLQPGHRSVLRAARGIVGDVLPGRNRSARRDGPGRQGRDRPGRRSVSHRDRLQDRQGRVEAQVSERRRPRAAARAC